MQKGNQKVSFPLPDVSVIKPRAKAYTCNDGHVDGEYSVVALHVPPALVQLPAILSKQLIGGCISCWFQNGDRSAVLCVGIGFSRFKSLWTLVTVTILEKMMVFLNILTMDETLF